MPPPSYWQTADVMKFLTGRGKRFILFIDDLSFEDQETDYKYIKSLLEGSAEKKPDNVIFYATSNRRHIIQQKWKDRDLNHMDEEVHGIEAMNEKLSLSQRFGITLTYPRCVRQCKHGTLLDNKRRVDCNDESTCKGGGR